MSHGGAAWVVEPASCVGPFSLGMGINEALAVVQRMGSLDRAELSFDDQRPLDVDIALRLPSLGLQLCFDGFQQDLRVISVRLQPEMGESNALLKEASMLPPLSYGGQIFASALRPPPTLRDLYPMLGPTWIGDFKPQGRSSYLLRYPGLALEVPLPSDMVETLAAKGEHPTEIPGLPPPQASQLWIFAASASSFLMPVSALPELPEAVTVHPAIGVGLHNRVLRFGSMPQDVFSDFGPPKQVCVKDVDAVRIHSSGLPVSRSGPDYYYNYFDLGLDVLFDGQTHSVKKLILHTNPPTHERFSRYSRCFFQIPIEIQQSVAEALGQANPPAEKVEPVTTVTAPPPLPREREDTASAEAPKEPVPRNGSAKAPEAPVSPEISKPCEGADAAEVEVAEKEESDEEFRAQGGKKPSKKDRKAAKKGRKGGSKPDSTSTSPAVVLETAEFTMTSSPEPSPLLAQLREMSLPASSGTSLKEESAPPSLGNWDGLLPPPALPLNSFDPSNEAEGAGLASDARSEATEAGTVSPPKGVASPPPPARPLPSATGSTQVLIDVRWPWYEIQEVLERGAGCSCGKPLVMSQRGHTSFGSTYFYAFPGLAFEVMQNGFVASLTVFNVPQEELPKAFLPKRVEYPESMLLAGL